MTAALGTALRLNRLAAEAAEQDLVRAFAAEASARDRLAEATRTIAEEIAAASSLDGDDRMVEGLATWLPHARAEEARARALLHEASSAALHCRTLVAAARSAEASIQALIDRRAAAAALKERAREDNEAADLALRHAGNP